MKKGECVLFVGAGLSRGFPQWKELVQPLADELGVFKGRIVIFSGEDIYILLVSRRWELADEMLCLTFVKRGTRPLAEKRVAQYSTRGYHVIVPMEIAKNYNKVFIIPFERKFQETKKTKLTGQ